MNFGVQARVLSVDECGLRYWRIPRRSPEFVYRMISAPIGAGGYFMEVPGFARGAP
ncbi:MAG TPA: hypothetical protein VLZ10_17415 [Thermodesulfobacteriota bacterium]|nr:hypothetical protein [Thermodesulfobacteriota bacterium]